MELTITGRQIEVTTSMRDYTSKKLQLLQRHFDQVIDVQVTLSVEKLVHQAEATIALAGKVLHAEAKDQIMYAAIDALVDKLDAQIKKHKERITDHHRGVKATILE